jgi:hypothetical protein
VNVVFIRLAAVVRCSNDGDPTLPDLLLATLAAPTLQLVVIVEVTALSDGTFDVCLKTGVDVNGL